MSAMDKEERFGLNTQQRISMAPSNLYYGMTSVLRLMSTWRALFNKDENKFLEIVNN